MKGQNSARWSRDLVTVFGLTVFALLLVLLINVNAVYASEEDYYLCAGDNEHCGGGGGVPSPPSPPYPPYTPSWMIDGYVVDFVTGATVSNVSVYLNIKGAIFRTKPTLTATTGLILTALLRTVITLLQ